MIFLSEDNIQVSIVPGYFFLNEFSWNDSTHIIPIGDKMLSVVFLSTETVKENSRYAGPLVIYKILESGQFYCRPELEFYTTYRISQ